MATLANLRSRILWLLDDPNAEGYFDPQIVDAINSAYDAILPWAPKLGTVSIVGTGASSYALPADFYEVQAVVNAATGQSLNRATLSPSSYYGVALEAANSWILYPSGYISFSIALTSDTTYTLYYTARYTEITALGEVALEPPAWTFAALGYYAASVMLVPQAISSATIRQFNTRVDSGTPEQNPMQKSVTFLQSLFLQEMNRNPKYQKVSV